MTKVTLTCSVLLFVIFPACREALKFPNLNDGDGLGQVEEVRWVTIGGVVQSGDPLVLAETLEDVIEVRRSMTGIDYQQHYLRFRLTHILRGEEIEINGVSWRLGAEVWVEASDPPCQNGTPARGSTVLLSPYSGSIGQTPSGEPVAVAAFLNMLVCSDPDGRLVFEDHPKTTMGKQLSDVAKVPLPVFEQALAEHRFHPQQEGVRASCDTLACSRGQRCFFGVACVEAENLAREEGGMTPMDGTQRSSPSVVVP